jgi:hypothetical protein
MGKAKFFILTDLGLELIIKILFIFFSAAIVYLMFNDNLVLRYIPINTKSLVRIGAITSVKGEVMRKLNSDSLYLPVIKGQKLFQDDLIVTGENSSVNIELGANNLLTTEPNSVIRLRIEGTNIFIQLQKGNFITHFREEKIINIKQGIFNNQVQIRKGSYLIKNSNAGIQVTSYSSQIKLKKPVTNETSTDTANQTKIFTKNNEEGGTGEGSGGGVVNESLNLLKVAKIEAEQRLKQLLEKAEATKKMLEQKELAIPIIKPNPKDKAQFLIRTHYNLTLAIKNICPNSCKLVILRNKVLLFEQEYDKGDFPTHDLVLDQSTLGHYDWTYTDNDDSFALSFEVIPFSPESFEKGLHSGFPIEIY